MSTDNQEWGRVLHSKYQGLDGYGEISNLSDAGFAPGENGICGLCGRNCKLENPSCQRPYNAGFITK